ncbi:MAG TPA: Fis family transcriptional regulator [Syntrophobacteraceae bacterium]|nr:Fis family transcriptional regulator [Syntrophobacteraceae bacterium]HBZ56019.1 Fis family transcriptional regulator [Syntrophobacteraceae bacterium]
MASVLIIDDDPMFCDLLTDVVRNAGHDAASVHTLEDGFRRMGKGRFDVVFLDVQMPDGDGLEVLDQVRAAPSAPEVIIVTGDGNADGAELAIRTGAWDYLEKPSSIQSMLLPLTRALRYRAEKRSRSRLDGVRVLDRGDIVGGSPPMITSLDLVAQAADSDVNVLIHGETGTGKELFALAIHNNSARAHKPFVVLDCSAIPETLVESMLFGHTRGAFTGADRAREGLVKQADGGTLFLDEVGELPLRLQKALLRVLQERRFRPLGGKREISSDFRLVSATNRDLGRMVDDGGFRKDLLFRLRSFVIELPPLRSHLGDIKDLTLHYMLRFSERHGVAMKGFAPDLLEALRSYPWPGNVRELINCIEMAMIAARHEPTLFAKHLPQSIRIHLVKASLRSRDAPGNLKENSVDSESKDLPGFREYRESWEKRYLEKLMTQSVGSIKKACLISGLSRSRLYELLKHHRITTNG